MSAAPSTADRLRRLLAILTWLAQVGEADIDDVAERFDLSPESLVAELELAACCGLPPYTPDQLMEIVLTDRTVSARLGDELARPRRLSPREGFALAASARALLAVPGSDEDGALSRALAKLDRALGAAGVVVELDAPELLGTVREAVATSGALEIVYHSASSDRTTRREIRPTRVFAAEGRWYVDALCSLAGDVRRFRVDRMSEARAVEATGGPDGVARGGGPGAPAGGGAAGAEPAVPPDDHDYAPFVPGPDARTVRLSLEPGAASTVESVPFAGPPERVGGRVEVDVVVGGSAWLERLLLRLGPTARVVGPPDDRGLAAEAAMRVLEHYQKH